MTAKETLDVKAVVLLTGLCILWGLNGVAIKISNVGIDPIFCAGIRSVIAGLGLVIWMKTKGMLLFPGSILDGVAVGILFGVEFAFLFSSLLFTTASSAWILLYTTPFFHTLGAHFFLKGDRITVPKALGLLLSFVGIVILLSKYLGITSFSQFTGDLFALVAAVLWAVTTIYIRKRLVGKITHHHTLFYQTVFSIPILFALSMLFGETPVRHVDVLVLSSVLFQGIIVAFISYIFWFYLVYTYPISRVSAFTFLTPVFGGISGILFLHEPATLRLTLSLLFVSLGIYVVNLKRP